MRKSFKEAASKPKMSRTANGMPTFVASGNALVDLFSAIGSSRGKDIRPLFDAAYRTDREKTLKILLWARDIRGGSGERQTVRTLLRHLEEKHPEDVEMLIPVMPTFGRWDDLLVFHTEAMRRNSYSVIAEGLDDKGTRSLVAKWMPRKGKIALELEAFLGLQPTARNFDYSVGPKAFPGKQYRKMLSELSNVVEQKMCAKEWNAIEFDHVPSLAAARYQKAFNKNAAESYRAYKAGLVKGTAKINAAAVYPYDVIKSIGRGDAAVAKAQWEALPDYLGDQQILAMVDTSGSMTINFALSGKLTCMDVALSLGLYIADKAKGAFKDCFLTFSGSPKIEVLRGDIVTKYRQMEHAHWQQNTNLMGAFMEVLRVGKDNDVDDKDMPKILLILSDLEFDACTGRDRRAMDAIKEMYAKAGYTLPKIVFWNLNARAGNTPVTDRESGTALVSGFSPAIMKSILKAADIKVDDFKAPDFSPLAVMEETISDVRYDVIDKQRADASEWDMIQRATKLNDEIKEVSRSTDALMIRMQPDRKSISLT